TRLGNGMGLRHPSRWIAIVPHQPLRRNGDILMMRALELYRHQELWQAAVKRAMHCDWSWARSAQRYDELYRRALVSRAARRPRASYGDANERS
ncbi:hypothetical protein JOD20_002215, partial [Herpetosiphon giganteus]|nr:hypothetical protein [Herpetosiphon giganteus]